MKSTELNTTIIRNNEILYQYKSKYQLNRHTKVRLNINEQ